MAEARGLFASIGYSTSICLSDELDAATNIHKVKNHDPRTRTKKVPSGGGQNASQLITNQIAELGDWRGQVLTRLRKVIIEAAPSLVEEWKWNTPVWSHNGNVVAVGAFRDHVKVNFFKGAWLSDPKGMFNAGLEAKATRAIDIHEGDTLNDAAFRELVRAAVALNAAKSKPRTQKKK